jgi:hypothetical protein
MGFLYRPPKRLLSGSREVSGGMTGKDGLNDGFNVNQHSDASVIRRNLSYPTPLKVGGVEKLYEGREHCPGNGFIQSRDEVVGYGVCVGDVAFASQPGARW